MEIKISDQEFWIVPDYLILPCCNYMVCLCWDYIDQSYGPYNRHTYKAPADIRKEALCRSCGAEWRMALPLAVPETFRSFDRGVQRLGNQVTLRGCDYQLTVIKPGDPKRVKSHFFVGWDAIEIEV